MPRSDCADTVRAGTRHSWRSWLESRPGPRAFLSAGCSSWSWVVCAQLWGRLGPVHGSLGSKPATSLSSGDDTHTKNCFLLDPQPPPSSCLSLGPRSVVPRFPGDLGQVAKPRFPHCRRGWYWYRLLGGIGRMYACSVCRPVPGT